MTGPVDGRWSLDANDPVWLHLQQARAARGARRADEEYREAVVAAHATGKVDVGAAVAAEHVDAVRSRSDSAAALRHCRDYRELFRSSTWLALVEAETRAARGDTSRLRTDLEALGPAGPAGRTRERALWLRLHGVLAHYELRHGEAEGLLAEARAISESLGDERASVAAREDLERLRRARRGIGAAAPVVADRPATTLAGIDAAEDLHAAGCFDGALDVLRAASALPHDPALDHVLRDLEVRLCLRLRRGDEADAALAALYRAADDAPDPDGVRAEAARLERTSSGPTSVPPVPAAPARRLTHVRRLIAAGELGAAEQRLRAERTPPGPNDRHEAEWHLAAGELSLALAAEEAGGTGEAGEHEALAHLERCRQVAVGAGLLPLAVEALRAAAAVHERRGRRRPAETAWAGARAHEERVAGLQRSDRARIDLITAVRTEVDEQIRVAGDDARGRPRAIAAVAAAIEAGRGAAILSRVLPEGSPVVRDLPAPGDERGARRWLAGVLRGLPAGQVVWLAHATPDAVHHVVAGRWTHWHTRVPCDRVGLGRLVTDLLHVRDGDGRVVARRSGQDLVDHAEEFRARLAEIASRIDVDQVVRALSPRVRRIVLVTADELADVPFAVLPGPSGRLGRCYALSDLPCLSLRRPLRDRARGQRGGGSLLLQPEPEGVPTTSGRRPIRRAEPRPGRAVLTAGEATPEALAGTLTGAPRGHGFGVVRVDSHGSFGVADQPSALYLHPGDAGSTGELHPEHLEAVDLRRTGTLIVGACRSGVVLARGRDERTGFVRSALLAGAGAVVAARWDAEGETAARVLDGVEDGLEHLPRDVALRRALLDADPGDEGDAAALVRWGAWTLYGDPGPQTRRGPLRRWWRRRVHAPARRVPVTPAVSGGR